MDNLNSLKANQDFLDKFYQAGLNQYRSAPFLKDAFESNVWKLELGHSSTYDIDFNIPIDGIQLPDCLNGKLCELFKMWICAAGTNSSPTSTLSNSTMLTKVTYATTAIDWLLLNNDRFLIHKYGLKLLNNNDLKVLFARGCTSPYLTSVAYDWPSKLTSFIVNLRDSATTAELESILDNVPVLTETPIVNGDSDIELNETLQAQFESEHDIFIARAALWKAGLYRSTRQSLFSVDTQRISRVLYRTTLKGVKTYPVPSALSLRRTDFEFPEYIRAPVSGRHSSLSSPVTTQLLATFETVNRINENPSLLPACGIDIPTVEQIAQHLNFSKTGRFTSLPVDLVLRSLRAAIEFYIDYGDGIISSYLNMMAAFAHNSEKFKSTARSQVDISKHVDSNLIRLKIKAWNKPKRRYDDPTTAHFERFRSLRSSPSLHELMQILFGAIQVTIGALQARRASELRAIVSTKCLSLDQRSLETTNRKTGLYGHNVKITRPIPQIAADMILSLEKMQHRLIELGLLEEHTNVLACANICGKLERISHHSFDLKFDIFCDYFETERDPSGRRYYFRNHQLRRFFAQVFFWHSDTPDCLEVLRWILGHGDSEMVYHYITENVPGQVLREVKAEWGAQMLRSSSAEVSNLADYILEKYKISNFTILPEDQLEEYIYHCLSDNSIEVEPEFLTTQNGDSYRITVTILDKGAHP